MRSAPPTRRWPMRSRLLTQRCVGCSWKPVPTQQSLDGCSFLRWIARSEVANRQSPFWTSFEARSHSALSAAGSKRAVLRAIVANDRCVGSEGDPSARPQRGGTGDVPPLTPPQTPSAAPAPHPTVEKSHPAPPVHQQLTPPQA